MKGLKGTKGWMARWAARLSYVVGVITITLPARAFAAAAAGAGALPWDAPLNTLQTDLQGPVAHTITTAAIIGAGLTWAFSEHGTGARKVSALAFGGAAALGAAAVMTALFPFAGALF
jgi:type IV secretory pathway VirB2 component (pilin)